jgi:predicted dehydrogenase
MQVSHFDGKKEPKQPVAIEGTSDICGNLRSFYQAVREGTPIYPSLADGARAVAVVFAAEDAARSGKTINVRALYPELFPA